jgi:hypothetical protein
MRGYVTVMATDGKAENGAGKPRASRGQNQRQIPAECACFNDLSLYRHYEMANTAPKRFNQHLSPLID